MIAGYQWRNIIPGGSGDNNNNNHTPHNRAASPGNRGMSAKQHAKEKLLEGNGAGDGHAMEKKGLAKLERDSSAPPVEFINQKLPKEMLLRVFSFLDVQSKCRSAQSCRFWSLLARDGSIWQDVDLFDFQKDIQGSVVENLGKRCGGFLKRLSLRGCRNVTDDALVLFAQMCINIEDLNIEECVKLSDETCKALGTYCKRLRRLRMASCSGITNVSLHSLGVGCNNLQVLDISWNGDLITEDGLAALARSAVQLRVLIAKGLRGMTDAAVNALATNCSDLECLNIHSCVEITDEAARALGQHCRQLQHLNLSKCAHLTDNALLSLAEGCPQLRTLELCGCSQLTDNGFITLFRGCTQLERLDLEECLQITDNGVYNLTLACQQLQSLSLSSCEQITDEGIRQLAAGQASTSGDLKQLELDNCPQITDASLEYLGQVNSLQRIDLYDCQLITRLGIRRLKTHLPRLEVHAYFAPATPTQPQPQGPTSRGICRCCNLL